MPSDPVQRCIVDFNVNDSATSLGAFLERIEPAIVWLDQRSAAVAPLIDMDRCQYLGPDAVALLAAMVCDAQTTNRSLRVRLPSGPKKLLGFCRFSGIGALVGGLEQPDETHPECETIPVRQWRGVPGLESERIIRLVRRHDSMHEDEEEYLRQCFNEIVQNVVDHSASAIGCVWRARYFSSTREVRVAIVDRGVGILQTIRRTHPQFSSASGAIRAVLQGHHTARSRDSNMGLGLSNLRGIVTHRHGTMAIVSDRGVVSFHHAKGVLASDRTGQPFRGTVVCFTLRLGLPT